MNSIEKRLPMVIPPFETYQSMAFVLGIIFSNNNIKNYFYNDYVKLKCINSTKMWDICLEYESDLWNSLREKGLVELDLFHSSVISKSLFISFLKERIDQGNYLLFYKIDEYFLSYSEEFRKKHYIHDLYIYGYTDKEFCVMAYNKGKLQLFNVIQEELKEAFYSCNENGEDDVDFCSCRVFDMVFYDLKYDIIKNDILDYIDGRETKEYLYGINIYRGIRESLIEYSISEDKKTIDIRIFRMLWEHKVSVRMHLEKLNDVIDLSKCIEEYREVETEAKKAFRLSLKYQVKASSVIIDRLIELVNIIEITEKAVLTSVAKLL